MLLKAQLPNNAPEQLQRMAAHLEQRLYQSAPTFGDYCNTTTLETRLKVVMKAMKSRLMHKQKRISNGKLRIQTLKRRLGTDMHAKTESLVQKIKYEKNELVGSSCAKCHFKEGPGASAFSAKTLPRPVRALFFQTPMVDAFDNYGPQRLETVDWEGMSDQAERNLEAYYEWKTANYVCYR
jgi:hypothetical protein